MELGSRNRRQLGKGKLQDEHHPQLIHSLSSFGPISYLSWGGAYVIALTPAGRVLTWGRGTSGQLGHGEMVNCLHPKSLESLEGIFITHASAGWNHSGFVSGFILSASAMNLICSYCQLGHGDYISRCSPVQVLHFKTRHIEQIACGDTEDLIYGFGSGKRGQLGISDDKQKLVSTPQVTLGFENVKIRSVTANGDHSAAISVNGHLYVWVRAFSGAPDVYMPRRVTADLYFSQVALGWNHTLVLTGGGEVYMLGRYNYNVPTGTQKVNMMKHISDGVMQRVLDFDSTKVVHIGAGAEHSALVTGEDMVQKLIVRNHQMPINPSSRLDNFIYLADDRSVMTWGWGEHGQLGLGDTNDQTGPRVVSLCNEQSRKPCVCGVYCGSGFIFVVRTCTVKSSS